MDDLVSDSEFTYNDVVPDASVNVEDDVLTNIENAMLRVIITSLSDEEKQVLKIVKQAIEKKISERQICREMGFDREGFRYKREKIFKKIQKSFSQN